MDGLPRGLTPSPSARDKVAAPAIRAIFDAAYYLRQYPDVAAAGREPLPHFLSIGWAEGRNPCALFDTELYLEHYPDIAQAGLNPLIHYVSVGAREGRRVSLLFDAGWYLGKNPDIAEAARANPLAHYLTIGAGQGREANPLFDQAWYLRQYPQAAQEASCALAHYAEFGLARRLSPHPLFDGAYYLSLYPDVAEAHMNPLAHFLLRGHEEVRQPHPRFDVEWYRRAYPDVAEAGVNPLLHYLWEGAREGRRPEPDYSRAPEPTPVASEIKVPDATPEPVAEPRAIAEPQAIAALEHSIDAIFVDAAGFGLLSGWIEDRERFRVEVRASAGAVKQRIRALPRPDVRDHLRSLGREAPSPQNGFAITFQAPPSSAVRLVATHAQSGETHLSAPLRIDATCSRIEQIWALGDITDGNFRDLRALYEIAEPAQTPPPSIAEILTYGPTPQPTPTMSVIVPFYRDCSYLLEHIHHQSLPGAETTEWIFVCDDPAIADQMRRLVSSRRRLLKRPTKLVLLSENGGYGNANNIGASQAEGETLLLLNSDIYVTRFDPFVRGDALLAQDPDLGCVGFTLLFEDGTLQHDGIVFEPLSSWDGLFIARHPRKGAPARMRPPDEAPTLDCAAVTGAAMLVRRRDFERLGGFDPAYTMGDFEDADLCMRLRRDAKRVTLLRNTDIYHLERQSFRSTGGSARREAMTFTNCMLFNARWRDVLLAAGEGR